MEEKIFWIDGFNGKAKGGYFIRNGLFEFMKRLEETGEKPVAIKIQDGWNLEVICEDKDLTAVVG